MENFTRPHKINKRDLLYLLFGLLVQVVAFLFPILFFRLTVHSGPLLQGQYDVYGEMSEPTLGRLIFMIVSFFIAIGLIFLSNYFSKKGKDLISFGISFCSGVFLWQSIGECSWHFRVGDIQIVRIECGASLPLIICFTILLIVCGFLKNKNFCIWIAVLSFACNWYGHFITLGTYPLVTNVIDWITWAKTMAITFGSISILVGLFLSLWCSKTKKGIYLASMLIFIGIGTIVFTIKEI